MLAIDLGLPAPKPYAVELSRTFVDAIPDEGIRILATGSNSVCFGSRRLPAGARGWIAGSPIPASMLGMAANIFAFDALIDNVDRRVANSNLLLSGEKIWIYDHELALVSNLVIFWKPPWVQGSRDHLRSDGMHVLFADLRGKEVDLTQFEACWAKITDEKLAEYAGAIPEEWRNSSKLLETALPLIASIRDNVPACIAEVRRVLQ